jgi:hypothetical protein
LTNLHLKGAVWEQLQFLHQLKLCANHAFPIADHW